MNAGLVLFEDERWRDLRPLTDTLPVPALAFGGSTLADRWIRPGGVPLIAIEARPWALEAWHHRPATQTPVAVPNADVLAANAAALPGPWLRALAESPSPLLLEAGGRLVAARISLKQLVTILGTREDFARRLVSLGLPKATVNARVIRWPWQMIEWNDEAITVDLAEPAPIRGSVHAAAVLLARERIAIAEGARIDPLAVLDARQGPISIGEGAVVQSHTLVVGPCAIGARTELLGGVVSRSTIGPECRIAGEVDASIWQGWSSKRHHGFVGHSVIGEWVNLGALTTTSDLKNNYGPVKVWIDGHEVDSGSSKVGSLIGAHVKTGIGTLLPTGATVGVAANLFGGGRFTPKNVRPFAWWDGEREEVHRLDKFLATAKIAMARRNRKLTEADEDVLRRVFGERELVRQ